MTVHRFRFPAIVSAVLLSAALLSNGAWSGAAFASGGPAASALAAGAPASAAPAAGGSSATPAAGGSTAKAPAPAPPSSKAPASAPPADTAKAPRAAGWTEYDAIRAALAGDSTKDVAARAKALDAALAAVSGAGKEDAQEAAKQARMLAAAPSIEAAREAFKPLSSAYIAYVKRAGATTGLTVFHCPMVPADWVQSDRDITNPYYGSSMLRCGHTKPWSE